MGFHKRNHGHGNTMKTSTALLAACACGSATAFAPSGPLSPRTSAALNLAVGETAPDFSLVDQNGKTFTRSQCKKPLVVYFYPADATPGCTKQATAFQAEIQDIRKEFRADVVGVSGQDVASKQKFAADLGLTSPSWRTRGTRCGRRSQCQRRRVASSRAA